MNKAILKNCLIFLCVLFSANRLWGQQVGDKILKLDFEKGSDAAWHDGGRYKLVNKDGASCIRIKSRKDNKFFVPLPVEKLRGTTVRVKARLKPREISSLPYAWNGVKIMIHIKMPWLERWPQALVNNSSNDWIETTFTAGIPEAADTAELVFGLENVNGEVWIDNIELTIADVAKTAINGEQANKMHQHTRYRGAMIPTLIKAEGLKDLAGWGANLVRWQLMWDGFPASGADTADIPEYTRWLDRTLAHVDSMLPTCRQLGIKVVLDLHTIPGGRNEKGLQRIFTEKEWQQFFVEVWKKLAARYKDETTIWAYDIANEPIEAPSVEGLANWQQLAELTAKEIRAIDPAHPIIIEGADGGSPWGMVALNKIEVPGIIYSFHMYEPATFTHQGLYNNPSHIYYPGNISGSEWNRATMKKLLEEIRKWQDRNNADIYVGEFSAIRWAPGESAYYYLRDCIELFEEMGWDWSYHAFREYDGWSVEHGNDRNNIQPGKTPTLRQQLLMEWYGKNQH